MVAIFIITRAFAVSALFAGAFQIASAAPVSSPQGVLAYNQYGKRWCRQMGCLFEVSTSSASSGTPVPTGVQSAYDSVPSADKMSVDGSRNRLILDEAETVFTTKKSGAETSEQPEDSEVSTRLDPDTQLDASDVHTVSNDSPAVEDLD